MKYHPLFATAACILAFSVLSEAAPEVTNVRASQRAGTKLVDVMYDLSNPAGNSRVSIEISVNGGAIWDVPLNTISGALGDNIPPGANKLITWNAGADFDGNLAEMCRARITAYDVSTPVAPPGMVYIPAGAFLMGSAFGDNARTVTISKAYFIDRNEVSELQWDIIAFWAYQNGYPLGLAGGSQKPALAYWHDWVIWANARSEMEGLEPCYFTDDALQAVYRGTTSIFDVINSRVDWEANGYRLPTEAEWEKAARGGKVDKRFPWGNTISHTQANYYSDESLEYDISETRGYHPASGNGFMNVGSFAPNGFGLYDVVGNSAEWVWDGSTGGSVVGQDPRGLDSWNSVKILKGSSFGLHYKHTFDNYPHDYPYGGRLVKIVNP